MAIILRNDDVNALTTVKHLQRFTELTDKNGYQVIHAITPRGVCWTSDGWLGQRKNSEIHALGAGITIEQNPELLEFLRSRTDRDLIGIHGLWHTHAPRVEEWLQARQILLDNGLYPQYLVPPYNEGSFKSHDFIVSGDDAQSFENESWITSPIAQMHSWRFDPEMWRGSYRAPWWTWDDLERKLQYPVMGVSAVGQQKYDFLAQRISGQWLDVGCNTGELLRRVPGGVGVDASLYPLQVGVGGAQAQAQALPFADNTFDTVVLCSVLEQCTDWKSVLTEALRVIRRGGKVIGTVPYPGTRYGVVGYTQWTRVVIAPEEFTYVEAINDEHYFFAVEKP